MNPIYCDTNIFILYFLGNAAVSQTLHQIGNQNILIPSVVYMKLVRGCGDREAQVILEQKLQSFYVTHIEEPTSRIALQLIQDYHLSNRLSIPDAFIAASALVDDFELFTHNQKDFRYIPGIRLYQPA